MPPDPPLACTVRGCGAPLVRGPRAWTCPAGHAFDIAKHGYVSLLQPQDRRSAQAGDSKAAVAARAALFAAGIGHALVGAALDEVRALEPAAGAVVADLGSGSGDLIAALAAALPLTAVGVDLSAAAADLAARRAPGVTWVVANADRRLPLLDASASIVLSIHGRRNPADCRRVLRDDGALLVAVPGPDDLAELRSEVHGTATARDRVADLLRDHASLFSVRGTRDVRERHRLPPALLRQLLQATYRGARLRQAAAVDQLRDLDVTFSSTLVTFVPQPRG